MHFNFLTIALCMLAVPEHVAAHPRAISLHARRIDPAAKVALSVGLRRRSQPQQAEQAQQISCTAPPPAREEAAAGEGEAKENEVEIESAFDKAVAVQGGDLKQDLVFTPSTVGKFEFEFQNVAADEVTVKENKAPAAPPAGFEALEPNSYVVSLATSKGVGLTLSKIDYIFDPTAAGLAGKDITKAQVGRLCTETGSFIISETLGELEFELEENEVTLNLNKNVTAQGEWGIFLPVAAAAKAPAKAAPKSKSKSKSKQDSDDSDDED